MVLTELRELHEYTSTDRQTDEHDWMDSNLYAE